MTNFNKLILCLVAISLTMSACHLTRTQKGAAVGTGAGAAIGAVVGRVSGNTALGAIIGATVGGVTGAVIGRKMDKQAEDIKNAIPNVTVERIGEGIIVEFSDKILFAFDKSDLSESAKANLNQLVVILGKYPDTNMEIQGHTDNTGTDAYNVSLSKRRANAVESYVRSMGIANGRVTTKGYGESAPKYNNDTDDNRSKNRRVEFLITANEKMKAEAEKEAQVK